MIIQEIASIEYVFLVLMIGMKKIFILIRCMKFSYQETKSIRRS